MREQLEWVKRRSANAVAAAALLVAGAGCVSGAAPSDEQSESAANATTVAGENSQRRLRRPVIFDTDMDFDDSAALAYLCEEHHLGHIELRAVTVANNGAGYPGHAIRNARCVLQRCGLPDVPVAEGAFSGAHEFPFMLRFGVDIILSDVLAGCTASDESGEVPAEELIAQTLERSTVPVTVLTTGPLTNFANALRSRAPHGGGHGPSSLANRIHRAYVMGGAVHTSGNLCCGLTETFDNSQELNIWGDPAAAQAVLDLLPPARVTLVALDATQHVPITLSFIARLQGDHHTPAADYVAALTAHPFIYGAVATGQPIFWWDPLAAVAAVSVTHGDVVEYEWERLSIVQEGPQSGRTAPVSTRSPGAWVRVAENADRELFEQVFLDTLNGREP